MNIQTELVNSAFRLMTNRSYPCLWRAMAILVGVILWNVTTDRLIAVENQQGLTAEIGKARVFYFPLAPVGAVQPADSGNQLLLTELEKAKKQGMAKSVPALEQFIATYPNSPWLPALRANLARYYQEHARYSKALQQWEAAWAATRDAKEGPAKQIADYTLAYWTTFLASLGETDQLGSLLRETEQRSIKDVALRRMFNSSRRAYTQICRTTDTSFRCGAYALNDVIRALKGPMYDPRPINRVPAPATGFSMTRLVELAKYAGVKLVAAEWGQEKTLVVPCVVHWKQNHYAAITAQNGDVYEVLDSALGRRSRWLTLSNICEEASGRFVVPKDKLPSAWQLLTTLEADETFGRGAVWLDNNKYDGCSNGSGGGSPPASRGGSGGGNRNDAVSALSSGSFIGTPGCLSCGNSGGSNGGKDGGEGTSCCESNSGGSGGNGGGDNYGRMYTETSGMAVWEVSEPYINVWVHDEPLGYQPGLGRRISFKLSYKQRDTRTIQSSSTFFNLGNNWFCSWLSYVEKGSEDGESLNKMAVPGGGARDYFPDYIEHEYFSNSHLVREYDTNNNWTGCTVTYPSGAVDCYHYVCSSGPDGYLPVAFLSAQIDPHGHTNLFIYEETNCCVLLRYVIDADGRTNTLAYDNLDYPAQITRVTDPFLRQTVLQYDADGMLTNVTDVQGLSSAFKYDDDLWLTNLATPYGNTKFEYYDYGSEGGEGPDPNIIRAVRVVGAENGTNIYMLRQSSQYVYNPSSHLYDTLFLEDKYPANLVPTDLPVNVNSPYSDPGVDNCYMHYRNSFHWGPRQAAGLPGDINIFTLEHFLQARMRHWLHAIGGYNLIGHTLNMEQEPSPDGQNFGQTTWYTYDGESNNLFDGTQSSPFLIARVLPDGTTWYTAYQRDQWGHPTNVVETYSTGYGAIPLTRTNRYVYDANGIDLIRTIGSQGETLSGFAYDGQHRVLRATNAVGEVTSYTYDAAGRLTSTRTPAGLTTTNIYYPSGNYQNRVQTRIDLEIGRTNSYTYATNLVYTHTDERGLTTTNTWDKLQRLTSVSDSLGTIRYTYDKLDLVRVVDRMGFTNSLGYDKVRRMIAQTNALGNYTLYNYCTCGALDSIRDAAGNLTYFSYDNAGRLIQKTFPDNYAINYHYSLLGQITNTTDSAGTSTTNWFNNQGLMYATYNAFGLVKSVVYDIHDRPITTTDANGVVLNSTYDNLGRVLDRTYPDSGVEQFSYSARGLAYYINQLGFTNFYGYDEAQRKTSETNANHEITRFSYSPAADLLTLTDGKNQVTKWYYDVYGRVTNKVDTLNNLMFAYGYDANNRLTNRWTPAKGGTAYRYDRVGNLTNIVYEHSSGIALQYDALNRPTVMIDGVGTTTYGYDAVGQLLSENGPWMDDAVSYTYNHRQRASVSVQAPNASAWTETYGYDLAKRLTGIASPAGSFGYVYDPARNMQVGSITFPGGAYITNTYDSVARMLRTGLEHSPSAIINSHQYVYNQANQRTQQVFTAGHYVNYTYDNIGQLQAARGKESGGTSRLHEQLGYGYDAAGNLNLRTNNALVQTFNVNDLNELTTAGRTGTFTVEGTTTSAATDVTVNNQSSTLYSDHTFAKDGFTLADGANTFTAIAHDSYGRADTNVSTSYLPSSISFSYDSNGNLIGDGRRCFAYDDENQLSSVWVTNAWRSDFVYDGKMRRRIRREYSWLSGIGNWQLAKEVRYVYDGNLVIQERDANNLPLVTHTRGRDLSGTLEGAGGIGGLLARTDNRQWTIGDSSAHAYYHADGNGNVTCLINTNQVIVAYYLYDPYGNILSQSGSLAEANTYRFSSKEFHVASGLVYYLYRFYEPNLQRWMNRDPINELGFQVLTRRGKRFNAKEGQNLYAFAKGAPTLYFDPVGTSIISSCCSKIAAAGALSEIYRAGINKNDDASGANSFTHCLAGCEVSKQCGKKGRNSWDGREDPGSAAGRQDLDNNRIGYEQANKKGSCWDNCMAAWMSGGLICGGSGSHCPPPPQRIPEPDPVDPPMPY